jgi:16S rRNA (cytosine1402-N4)-methyltransferase
MNHITVLLKETINLINPKDGGIYFDLTLGGGGHSLELLSRVENVTIYCFDVDKSSLENFISVLSADGFSESKVDSDWIYRTLIKGKKIVHLLNKNFAQIQNIIQELKIEHIDGVMADLGWSTDQLENIPGLSYQNESDELDMRFNPDLGVKASDLLNALSKKELMEMFTRYADIRGSQNERLVNSIIKSRSKKLIQTVGDIVQVVQASIGSGDARNRFNNEVRFSNLSRIFQALRIAVNNEMQNLKDLLSAVDVIAKNGKFAVITFHSGEDRVVREFAQNIDLEKYQIISNQYGELFTRPGVDELMNNLKARSAKLWVIEKIN